MSAAASAANGHASTSTEPAAAAAAASSGASKVQPSDVGWQFVPQYYNFVNKQPHRLHCFYNKRSTFIHGEEGDDTSPAFGQQEIHERIVKIGYDQCKVYINSIDSQSSANGGVIIQVLGEMSNANKTWRKFAQTFFLAEQPNGYFVLNDIFRYLKEETDEDEEPEVDGAPGVSSAPGTHADAAHAQSVPTAPVAIEQEEPDQEEEVAEPEAAAPEEKQEEGATAAPESEAASVEEEKEEAEKVPETTPAPVEEEKPAAPAPAVEEKPEAPAPVAAPVAEKAAPATPANGSAAPSGAATPAAQPAPAAAPAAPAAPPKPAAPKSWASLAAGGKAWATVTAPAAAAPAAKKPEPAAAPAASPSAAPATAAAPAAAASSGLSVAKGSPAYDTAMKVQTPHCFVKLPNWSTAEQAHGENIDENTLRNIASRFGDVLKVEIVKGKACAFVEFSKVESARKAIVASLPTHNGGEGGVVHGEGKINFEMRKEKDERGPKFRRGGAPETGGGRGGGQQRTGGRTDNERGATGANRGGRGRPRGGAAK